MRATYLAADERQGEIVGTFNVKYVRRYIVQWTESVVEDVQTFTASIRNFYMDDQILNAWYSQRT